jgi:putative Mg2+ transporter-C (MgtC) family protein
VNSLPWDWIDLAKLLLAMAVGAIVGFERQSLHKPAGITTITMVTLCSTLLMELSYSLSSLGIGPSGADPARLAAAVITGVGFLGAGMIIQAGGHVQGVTTSATIWVMTGVGLAIGAGYYVPALTVVAMVLLGFWLNPWLDQLVELRTRRRDERGGGARPGGPPAQS